MPCMKSTSACANGGKLGLVPAGNVVLGWPGAPGCTTTGCDVPAWPHAGATNNPAEPLKAASKPNTDATTVADLVLSLRGSRLNLVLGVEPTISSALTLTRPPRDKEARKAVWSSGAGLPLSVQRSRKWECVHPQAARCSSPFQPVPLESPYVRNCRIRRSQEGGSSHH